MNLDANVRKGFTKEVSFQLITKGQEPTLGKPGDIPLNCLSSKWHIFVSFSSYVFGGFFEHILCLLIWPVCFYVVGRRCPVGPSGGIYPCHQSQVLLRCPLCELYGLLL